MIVLTMGCGTSSPNLPETPALREPTEVEMVSAMEEHYTLAIRAHDALIRGEIDAAKSHLSALSAATLPERAPEAWSALHGSLKTAAAGAARADDLPSVARGLAAVAETCGDCHTALGRGPNYPAPAPPDAVDLPEQMRAHQFATERLWEGITGRWEYGWLRGTELLAASAVFRGEISPELSGLEADLRTAATLAGAAATPHDRAIRYGEILAMCAVCHRAANVVFQPQPLPPNR